MAAMLAIILMGRRQMADALSRIVEDPATVTTPPSPSAPSEGERPPTPRDEVAPAVEPVGRDGSAAPASHPAPEGSAP